MTTTAAAIYERGVLRPLAPLPIAEGARVEVTVSDESGDDAGLKTGALLAQLWSRLPHLSAEEAAAFERDLSAARTAERPQAPPAWE